jgi:hypothetical protein
MTTEDLRNLESRKEQLVQRIASLQRVIFTTELTIKRKQEDLENAVDDDDRTVLDQQILQLQSSLSAEQNKLTPLQQQLTQLESQITESEKSAFPGFGGFSLTDVTSKIPSIPALSSLINTPVTLPVNPAEVLKQIPAVKSIPGLDTAQITGLLGSAATAVKQTVGSVSSVTGIGKFGLTPEQLESQGLIKPGTVDSFISSAPTPVPTQADIDEAARTGKTPEEVAKNKQLNSILSSPSIWTGKNGVKDFSTLLSNENLQSITQQNVMGQSLTQLKSLGVLSGNETASQIGSLVQTATKFGAAATALWTKGKAPADITTQIGDVAKNAQQAISLVNTKLPDFGAVPFDTAGATATVNRAAVDSALISILGSPKIPIPGFGTKSLSSETSGSGVSLSAANADLTYTGSDPIVWDRVNAERIRRGLSGLDVPRPPDIVST